jgi:protein-tyrosine phosphatase
MKILMVCLGNICRSPIAEGVLAEKCKAMGLDWKVDSAGTNGLHNGEKPHPMSQSVAKLNGIDISHQRSRAFKASDMDEFDLIIPMASDVMRDMKYIAGKKYQTEKVKLLLNYAFPSSDMDVPDPWSKSIGAYHEVYGLIEDACNKLIEFHTSTKQH